MALQDGGGLINGGGALSKWLHDEGRVSILGLLVERPMAPFEQMGEKARGQISPAPCFFNVRYLG